jgi:CBS domain containing-hemolysin-like protein
MGTLLEILCCLAVSFLFSGIEAGMLSVNKVRLRHRAKFKDNAARVLNRLLSDPERMLITVLLVNNAMQILALALGVKWATRVFGTAGYWVVCVIALPVWVLGVELLPKALFRRFPYRALAVFSSVLVVVEAVLRPVHILGMGLIRLLYWNRPPKRFRLFGGREDFKIMTQELERTGGIAGEERALINAVLDFRYLTAMEVLVPFEKAGAVRGDVALEDAREVARSLGVERLPVLDQTGQVTGLLDLYELALQREWHGTVEIFQRRIVRVDSHEPAHSIMRKLRSARLPMAVVRGPDGLPAGVVLWDDLVRLLLQGPAGA